MGKDGLPLSALSHYEYYRWELFYSPTSPILTGNCTAELISSPTNTNTNTNTMSTTTNIIKHITTRQYVVCGD